MSEQHRLSDAVAARANRRGFLARASRLLLGAAGGSVLASVAAPEEADAYHFCGHTYTTGSCPHPTGLPRVDIHGMPIRARDGKPVDDLGRRDRPPRPSGGCARTACSATPTAGRCRPRRARRSAAAAGERYGIATQRDGSWYRCCGGTVRQLLDCCSYSPHRINGDGALTGYCYAGRKVFCVHYYQTDVPC